MNIPGFTADVSLYRTSGHYGSLSKSQSMSLLPKLQMALLPGGAAPGVHGKKCGPCSGGWRNCWDTLDGKVINDVPHKELCQSCGPCLPTLSGQFMQNCVKGGSSFSQPCTVCNKVTIPTPWPLPDICLEICCNSVNFSSCSLTQC
jgi:hypothetical protein